MVTPIAAGIQCAAGGEEIQVGLDTNGDGVLEASEVQHTSYVCNGAGSTKDGGVADAALPGDASDAAHSTDAGSPSVAALAVPDLTSTALDVVAYSFGVAAAPASGGGAGKPSVSALAVTVRATPTSALLFHALTTGAHLSTVTLTAIDPGGGVAPLVLRWTGAVVSSIQDGANDATLETVTFVAAGIEVKTPLAIADFNVTMGTGTCTGACCGASRGPYVVADPTWAVEPNAIRVLGISDAFAVTVPPPGGGGGAGKPTASPIAVLASLEPTVPCAVANVFEGTVLSPTTLAFASPLSATEGALETETLLACQPTMLTTVTVAGGAGGATEHLELTPGAFVETDRAFDGTGMVTAQQTEGWSFVSGMAITACP